jgi:parallel beta-helix repeat protein
LIKCTRLACVVVFGQKTKLTEAVIAAVLLASVIVGISNYVVPHREIPVSISSQSIFSLYSSAALTRIYVDTDGMVYPTNVPIVRSGNVYSFTGDMVNYTLEIQKDNIIIDGMRRSFKGYVEGSTVFGDQGIILNCRTNVTIKNINIENFGDGIVAQNCSRIIFDSININSIRSTAITLESCNYVNIFRNGIINVGEAIDINPKIFDQVLNYTVAENTLTNAVAGIQIHSGLFGTITKNSFDEVYNPIWVASNSTIISNNIMTNGIDGIAIGDKNSDVNHYYSGGSSCTVSGNTMDNFTQSGISFNIGINNTLSENTITNSEYGVAIDLGGDIDGSWVVEKNTLYHNNFINNVQDVFTGAPSYINNWDDGKEGNYWSKFNGSDNNRDGISDVPYNIFTNNTDRYPLMNPYGKMEIQQTLSGQVFIEYLGICLVLSIIIMVVIAFYVKRRKTKTVID